MGILKWPDSEAIKSHWIEPLRTSDIVLLRNQVWSTCSISPASPSCHFWWKNLLDLLGKFVEVGIELGHDFLVYSWIALGWHHKLDLGYCILNTTSLSRSTTPLRSYNVEPDPEHAAPCCSKSITDEMHRPTSKSSSWIMETVSHVVILLVLQ